MFLYNFIQNIKITTTTINVIKSLIVPCLRKNEI